MLRRWLCPLLVAWLSACDSSPGPGKGPREYLSKEYFEKQRICEEKGPRPRSTFKTVDLGRSLHQRGRPAEWNAQRLYLGNTCFLANVGPVYYFDEKHLTFYSVDIEAQVPAENGRGGRPSWLVLFSRDIDHNELPSDIESIRIRDIVYFDEGKRVVSFGSVVIATNIAFRRPNHTIERDAPQAARPSS